MTFQIAQSPQESMVIGTAASPTNGWKIPASAPTITPDRPAFKPTSSTGNPNPRPVQLGKQTVRVSYNLECNPASVIPSFKGFFGGEDIIGGIGVAAPVYPHRFHLSTLAAWYFEEQHPDLASPLYRLASGLKHGSVTLKFAQQGFMEATFNGSSLATVDAGTTAASGTVIDTTGYEPFNYIDIVFKKNGTIIGYAQTEEFTIDRKLMDALAQDQTHGVAAIGSNEADFSGKITALLVDNVLPSDAAAGLEGSMEIWMPHQTGYGMLVEIPAMKLRPAVISGTGFKQIDTMFDAYGRTGVGIPGRVWSGYWTTTTLPSLSGLTLIVSGDAGANETFTFAGGDTTLDLAATKINATAIRVRAVVDRVTGASDGILRIESLTKGPASSVQVQAASTADALLGFDNNLHSGLTGEAIVITVFSPLAA